MTTMKETLIALDKVGVTVDESKLYGQGPVKAGLLVAPRYELHLVNTAALPAAVARRLRRAYQRSASRDGPLYEVYDTVARRPVAWVRQPDAPRILELYNRTTIG